MLTVCLTTYPAETMTLYNALETATLRCSNRIEEISFNKNILNSDLFAKLGDSVILCTEITELHDVGFGCGVGFLEMA